MDVLLANATSALMNQQQSSPITFGLGLIDRRGCYINGWLLLGMVFLTSSVICIFPLLLRALVFTSRIGMGKERRPGAEKGMISARRNIRLASRLSLRRLVSIARWLDCR
jgi:hypothetical protein